VSYFVLFFRIENLFYKVLIFLLLFIFSKEFVVINEEFIIAISFLILFYMIIKYGSDTIENEFDHLTYDLYDSYFSLIDIKYLYQKKLLSIYVKKTKLFRSLRRIIGKFEDEVYYITERKRKLSKESFNRYIKSLIISFIIKRNFKLRTIYNKYLVSINSHIR